MTVTPDAPASAVPAASLLRADASPLRQSGLRRVAAITATLVGTQAATSLLGFIYWTIATHRFPVSSVGVATDATSTMQLLGSFGMLGFGTLLIARLPSVPHDRRRVLVRSCLAVVAAASAVLGLVAAGAVGLLPSGGLAQISASPADAVLFAVGVALTGVTLVIDQAVLTAGSGLVQLERNVVASFTKIGFLIALSLAGQHGGMAIYLSWILGTLVSLPVVLHRTRNPYLSIERPRWIDRSALTGTWRAAAGHHTLNLALQAPLMLFPAIITLQSSTRSTGYFATVLLLAGFVFVLPYAVSIGLFASAATGDDPIRARMRFTLPFGIAASLCADAVLLPLAPWVLRVFGAGYATHGATALRLIVLAGLPFVIKDHYVALRRVEDHAGRAARVMLVTSIIEIVAAIGGARVAGTTGLIVAWLVVLFAEAAVLGVVLLAEVRTGQRAPVGEVAGADPGTDPHVATSAPEQTVGSCAQAEDDEPAAAPAQLRCGPVFFAMAVGTALEAIASVAGNDGVTPAAVDGLFWVGLAMIFTPAAGVVLSRRASGRARLGIVLLLGVLLQVSRFALFPTQFVFHDELAHANTLRLIGSGHHLFATNPLLPVSPFYPGLELATNGIHVLFGLPDRAAAIAVLLLCRGLMVLAVYLGLERVSGSSRLAAVASVVYVCNEQYLFFNSQFSYQSIALPLALFAIYGLLRLQGRERVAVRDVALPVAAAAATTVSHHLTGMLLAGALLVWAAAERHLHGPSRFAVTVRAVGLVDAAMVVGWIFVPGNPVRSYLYQIGATATDAVTATLARRQSHALFNAAGYRTPAWEIALSILSELLLISCGVIAARAAWKRRTWRLSSLALLLCLLALAFPIVPAGHLTGATSEVTDRASGFVFLGVAFLLAAWLLPVLHRGRPRRAARSVVVALTAGLVVLFLGQTILGSGPQWAQTPGSFLVSADSRSIDRANLSAAAWEARNLPEGTRVIADRDGSLLAGSVGGLYPVSHIQDGVNGSPILLSPTWTPTDAALVRRLAIQYVIIDRRDATGLPRLGVYYESGEYDQDRTAPVPAAALAKLQRVPGVTKVYDNGSVAIYDVTAIEEAT
jgi:O-antigen/teichoic acid export membrane protein